MKFSVKSRVSGLLGSHRPRVHPRSALQQEDTVQDFQQQLSSIGWTADAVERQVKEIRARHSHQAGVSMAYLLRDFVQLAQEKSGEVDPTFLRLKEVFWLADHKLGQDRYCPRDGKLGCALVDMLPFQHRRKQNHFMSWSWQYSLGQLLLGYETAKLRAAVDDDLFVCFLCFFFSICFIERLQRTKHL